MQKHSHSRSSCCWCRFRLTGTEFPVINPKYVGRQARYVYYATMARGEEAVLLDGVIKVDVSTGTVCDRIVYGRGLYGGECVFVAREGAVSCARLRD